VEQAQIGLDAKRKQIAFDLQSAEEGVHAAEAQLAKLTSPSPYDLQAVEEQARAAESQAGAARAQVDALVSQKAGAEAGIQAATSGVRQAEAALALRQNPITAEDLRAARAGVQQAQAALDAVRAQRADAFVTAPVSGIVGSKLASVGSLAAPGAPLVTIVSEGVEVTLPVEEARVGALQPGQRVTLVSPAFPGQRFDGSVLSVTPSADPRSRTFTARIRPESGALRPGMSVQVSVQTDERAAVPVVARDALIQRDGRTSVYVVGAGNKAELRQIRLGLVSGPLAEVVEGLIPGDKVVTTGIEDLRTGQEVAIAAR
jgi:multidrug efflux pump subunit AcrA (membrane-fusion protein)